MLPKGWLIAMHNLSRPVCNVSFKTNTVYLTFAPMKGQNPTIDTIYITSLATAVLSFAFPSFTLVLGSETYTQYFISSYGGRLVLAIFLLFGIIWQGIVFYKKREWMPWTGMLCGLYISVFAGNQLWKCLVRFETTRQGTLIDKLQPACTPLAGLWLLLTAGMVLLLIAAIKIIRRSLSEKRMVKTTTAP